ncbi:phage portal protein [Acerihabitans arboris]|uniref:Phage portal protein n=1 Tax=Acerihabitans arboris TaxID=2691583 RepID=A0A845SN55_9GAMM|nr:phage portal protein [Acerihabitans arboris]NDL64822.1 phage portal protein [Acerihabitans arboris]
MSRKKRRNYNAPATDVPATLLPGGNSTIFFGPPELVLTTGTDYQEVWYDNSYDQWTLPISRLALARLANASPQHSGILYARRNMVTSDYDAGGLTHAAINAAVFDYLTFGDVAILKIRDRWGRVVGLYALPSLYLRRRKTGEFVILQKDEPLVYQSQDIRFLTQYDPQQQVYGLPDYIGGINSALLNSEAVVFRRRYYANGAHMGGILYTTDPNMSAELEEEIKKKIQGSKGIGNFKNLYINIPNGKEKGVQFIPVGDISAKDEFANVKNISAQDVLNAHRFPAGLAGIIPQNTAGLGDPTKWRDTYRQDEVIPIQRRFMATVNGDPEIPAALHLNFNIIPPTPTGGA